MGKFEQFMAFVNPKWGTEREKYKRETKKNGLISSMLSSSYDAGSSTRRHLRDYLPSDGDADKDTLETLPKIRARSRDLVRNFPIAGGAINTKVSHVVGSGIRPQSTIDNEFLGLTDDEAVAWQKKTEREFKLWAESPDCDLGRKHTFYSLQRLAYRSQLENGDVFANLPFQERVGQPYNMRVQLIEADRVSNPKDMQDGYDNIWGGVEKDEYGAPVAYHVSKFHPGATYRGTMSWARLAAYGANTGRRNVLHVSDTYRVDQTRGVPDLAPVVETLKQMKRYTDAELTAAIVAGVFTVFVETEAGDGFNLGDTVPSTVDEGPNPADYPGGFNRPISRYYDEPEAVEMEGGSIINLAKGEKISTADPGRPNTAFDPFMTAIVRQIGVGLDLPYEVIIKHFTASYSAARAALLEAWLYYQTSRMLFVSGFCQPIYEEWLTEAVAIGRISAPGYFDDIAIRKAYAQATWVGPGKGQIQPLQETNAAIARIAAGISTISKEALEYDASDWETLHKQSVREQQMRVDGKLALPVDAEMKLAEKQAAAKDTATEEKDTADNED